VLVKDRPNPSPLQYTLGPRRQLRRTRGYVRRRDPR